MSTSIKQLVDRGLELHRRIARDEEELKAIDAALSNISLFKDHQPLEDEEREGKRYLARGTNDIVPVVFTADKLMGSFGHNSAAHARVRVVCDSPTRLGKFFKYTQTWENKITDGKKFRIAALEEFGAQGPAFIAACRSLDKDGIPKSDIKILWKETKPV